MPDTPHVGIGEPVSTKLVRLLNRCGQPPAISFAVAVTEVLLRDAEALHRALAKSGSEVRVAVSRETAELVSRVVDTRARGEEILLSPGNAEVTPTEAAVFLGMSRPQVRKLMDQGLLEYRKVGTHHRIGVSSIRVFLEAERPRRREALAELAALQNDLGLTE